MGHSADPGSTKHEHFILPDKLAFKIFFLLIVGTILTVAAAQIHIGIFNFPLAMLIASIKAYLVMSYFMGLKFDLLENKIYFLGSLLFVLIFIVLTASDLLFREVGSNNPDFIRKFEGPTSGLVAPVEPVGHE